MTVIIGIDPHKASHTAVAIGCDEHPEPPRDSWGPVGVSQAVTWEARRRRSGLESPPTDPMPIWMLREDVKNAPRHSPQCLVRLCWPPSGSEGAN